ncbi:MAG: carbon-nitrogen family hydrolase [Candidatus Omnitrophota bacterium]|jgi:predicted amidohydrolase|nr:MAG: carbon-nitrogen family hydrolase [Candidatus Omnitrophota bacterium]
MNVYGIQYDIVWEDKTANFEKIRSLLKPVEIEPGSLIVLSEMFASGFSMNVAEICEGETRESAAFLAELAKTYRCTVVGGLVMQTAAARGRNQALVVDPDGRECARYCKLHPFTFGGEAEQYEAGNEIVTFRWHDFTVAPFICYDLRFPEVFRCAVLKGVELYVVIACWPDAREEHWMTLLKARAIENQAYVVGVNRCGTDPKLAYSGRSMIFDPRGNLLADGANEEEIICAELDRAMLLQYRCEFPVLKDMRGEMLE